jgi:small subunit ribosomal protein S4
MARDMGPVLKRCRSLGIEPQVLGIDKKSNRTNARAGKKVSEYGLQLREKQKAKFIYGVLEKPFRNNFEKAQKIKEGTTGDNMLVLLELRLDNVMFRLGYARTRKEARQIVGHKHVLVNGKCVNIPSYQVKAGDVISICEKGKSKGAQRYKDIFEVTEGRTVPSWLEADHENFTGKVVEIPSRDVIDVPVNPTLIVELYSK